ncbi:MAG TPA: cytochrome c maturation protein CcmE [Gammaproteobacteria bacterium]|nr:cytochrome c maturation protein CcmE [Gammaproteobacteria bacterium]
MKPRHKRLVFVVVGLAGLGVGAALVLQAFKSNLVFFFSPSQLVAGEAPADRNFRLGGLVLENSVQRQEDGITVGFVVTDRAQNIKVTYTGILPDLFKEGEGVVAMGRMGPDGVFHAEEVLAKHDETYMPPEVAEALEEARKNKGALPLSVNQVGGE